jgi:hypothetical protein
METKVKRKVFYLMLASFLLISFSFLFVLEKIGIKNDGIAKKINKKLLDKNIAQAQCSACAAASCSCNDDGGGGN